MDFNNKNITVMGLGLLGRGTGLIKYLLSQGARLTVTDLKSKKMLAPSIKEVQNFYSKLKQEGKNIHKMKFILGEHRLEDFKTADFIFKTAGVPLDSIYIEEARKNEIPVLMDDALFGLESPCPVIGVTGTRGKTTTATLIYELLKETRKKVYLAGNIKGMATLPLVRKIKKDDLAVLELSSWQLQGWEDLKISPHVAVVTNIFSDHMNYYKNDFKKYLNDKAAIFKNQTKKDFLILNKNCIQSKMFAKMAKGKVIWFSAEDVPKNWKVKIVGKHNLENIAAAMAVGRLFKIPSSKIKKIVESFVGVPGRLQFIKEKNGARYYNDTTSTMPEATIAALSSLGEKAKNIILIAGGTDKNLDFKNLAQSIKNHTKGVVLLNGTATEKISQALRESGYSSPLVISKNMKEAVGSAKGMAEKGDIVLFSPASTSFGMFKNEYDRGEHFEKEISALK
ncbi:UDP-N-acetylmuramoylalanine--D-glutamate ligase [Candidatus Falkowbacteria bacterium RIFOXYB2_FULL_38_15]|uniref:UDP-N-acetylmuramoylalanine--D-glutamate ligase n=1 Tax=Candidatus Falkowbacteria bacterium RIFOXYA2_FULL_38_12 TaxID=1797993 RepID=A0A1F5S1R7_9BACT|nr:MAG: UDP-N-acetylmuramoylalanine--D-glutamate ligase [Candidatus Falkowbacteria bacterium RIFOXYA2_FULL_38_12]OGF32885.1 MAG: UDP-N-acetylmuramoylalanine--D-glutamate ligase [Candidatus Falkowbacteria bacterium RIFOXYB2_FULL_38_15]OGF44021.1 MAG: UDP-N-acetylmuramoylalanine--D-glutamate ligase [Candidatus Falkowbacteria bacterium RIFOXYD2_FULL_39_16]